MTGYPIAWTEKWTSFDSDADGSPYTATEVEDYLVGCRAQYSPKELPLAIRSIEFVISRSSTTRRFWLWRLLDDHGTEWFALVGSGTSPFFGHGRIVDRWVYAQTNDGNLAAEDFLAAEIAKHP